MGTDPAALLAAHEAQLDEFKATALVVLRRWADEIGFDQEEMVADPLSALLHVERVFGDEDLTQIEEDDLNWLGGRLLGWVGAVFIRRRDGEWVVDARPDSPSYTSFVVRGDDGRHYDPSLVVRTYFEAPAPRNLVPHLDAAEAAAT